MFDADHQVFDPDQENRIKSEFKRFKDVCYMDHTGSAQYCQSYIEAVSRDLCDNIYSNPHSHNLTSKFSTDIIDQVRYRILRHFNTNPDEYSVVFTSGATGALKLVAETFEFSELEVEPENEWHPAVKNKISGHFVYMEDNHTSVLGMRQVAEDRGVSVTCLNHENTLRILNEEPQPDSTCSLTSNSLFVYSAQCNFSGVKYPLSWISKVHQGALNTHLNAKSHWFCMLDAASYLSTSQLDLSQFKPDFVCMSFYKIFGYPTGIGALLVRNSSARLLRKGYYGGGTVLVALSSRNAFVPRPILHERFEDGSLNFLSIVALRHGFDSMTSLVGTFDKLSRHTFELARYLFTQLSHLHHSNGRPGVRLYADTTYSEPKSQGGIVNFNLLRANGEYIGFAEVLQMANLHGIQLRTGCFCNPGACRRHLGLSVDDVKSQYQSGHVCGDDLDLIDGRPTGSVRVSFGPYSIKDHVDRLLQVLEQCFIDQPSVFKRPGHWEIEKSMRNQIDDLPINSLTLEQPLPYSSSECSPKLSHIFVYPVKSCGRLQVSTWTLDSTGLQYDRQWMIVDAAGAALTQKRVPALCKIRPFLNLHHKHLILKYDNEECAISLVNQERSVNAWTCQSKVCGHMVQGQDCGDEIAGWLERVLGIDGVRMLRQDPNEGKTDLSLANQGQYLLISKKSVDWLADLVQNDLCTKNSMIDRFRSNFVLTGIEEAFIEQDWTHVTIGSAKFNVDGPCRRCQMICIDQDTGERTKEPLTTLTSALKGKMRFGIYLSQIDTYGHATLSVGDAVTYY